MTGMKRIALHLLLALFLTGLTMAPAGPTYADARPTGILSLSPHLGYGMMLAWPGHLPQMTAAGFDWYKYFLYWDDIQPTESGGYNWSSLDWRLSEAAGADVHLILRVERPPAWARAWNHPWAPVRHDKMAAWQEFFRRTALHIHDWQAARGETFRVALEVWNEPNLSFQWGDRAVDPAWYTEMVRAAYDGAHAGDPHIIVVAGGLAPTGGTPDGMAMNDVSYLEAMYTAGLSGHFDAISIHNYGFGGPPEDDAWGSGILNFRRAEDIHAVMVAHGDGDRPVWASEFGWLLDSDVEGVECDPQWQEWGFAWQQVSAARQADYLVRAFQYADANWPWMGVMVVSNLDFSTTGWYATCDPLNWFSVLRPNGSARSAYTALQGMEKRYRSWAVWGMAVAPSTLLFLADVDQPGVQAHSVMVSSTGTEAWGTWSVLTASAGLAFTVTPTGGAPGQPFTVRVDTTGYPLGAYTGVITVTASEPQVPESPYSLPVTLRVVDEVYRRYLPVVRR